MSIKIFKRPFQKCHVHFSGIVAVGKALCILFSSTRDETREATGLIRNAVRHAVRLNVPPCNFVALSVSVPFRAIKKSGWCRV